MEEESSSWIRRTTFSHTVFRRWDSARLASVPFDIELERMSGLKSRPDRSSAYSKSFSTESKQRINPTSSLIQRHPITNKQRTLSPLPETVIPDSFKEARSVRKQFSTPHPQRREPEKRNKGKSNTSPIKRFTSMKFHDRSKTRRDSAWVTAGETTDETSVDLSKLFLGLRFAYGAHSRLYHGIYNDEAVAVKIIRVPDDDINGTMAALLEKQYDREVTMLSRLHHQNVIKFIGACRNPPVYCVITEYLSKGSLRAYLHRLENKSLPLQKLIAVALDIAHGMEYIHSQCVIHRDLKPENILIDEEFHLKIADFGIACQDMLCDSLSDDPGTYRWMAPEMIKRKSYGRRVDVYSFGLMLWEMVAGTIPYEDMTPIQAAFAVVNKNLRPPFPADCPPSLRALIEQCWSLRPEKRPEFWQIVKVLEQFESSIAVDGTLNLVESPACQDHKKGLRHWIQKLGPMHPHTAAVPKPKIT